MLQMDLCRLIMGLLALWWYTGCLCVVVQVERERSSLLVQTFKQLNTQYSRRMNGTGCPLVVHRVKVTFRDEPGEGSGVARSFYTAFCQAILSAEKLPNLEPALVGSKSLQYSTTVVRYLNCSFNYFVICLFFNSFSY